MDAEQAAAAGGEFAPAMVVLSLSRVREDWNPGPRRWLPKIAERGRRFDPKSSLHGLVQRHARLAFIGCPCQNLREVLIAKTVVRWAFRRFVDLCFNFWALAGVSAGF